MQTNNICWFKKLDAIMVIHKQRQFYIGLRVNNLLIFTIKFA